MKTFFLSYVSELCIYLRFCLSSSWFCPRLRTDLTNQYVLLNKPVCFTVANILLSYVKETVYLLRNLPFFKIHGNRFTARDDSPCANVISERMLRMRGLVPLGALRHFLSLISSLLVGMQLPAKDQQGRSFCPFLVYMSGALSISFIL